MNIEKVLKKSETKQITFRSKVLRASALTFGGILGAALIILFHLFVALILVLAWTGNVARQGRILKEEAIQQISFGMSRELVQTKIQQSWIHYDCPDIDIYLFGSRNLDLAAVLVLGYELEYDIQVLARISTYEGYLIPVFYDHCRT